MNNTDLFDGYAKAYTTGRPDYARKLIDHMYDTCGISKDSTIADIGSGTGIPLVRCREIPKGM